MKQFSIITLENTNNNFHCASYERYRYKPDFKGYWHSHTYTEIFFVTDGSGFFYTKDNKIPISKGMVIINNGHVQHMESSAPNMDLEYAVLCVENLSFHSNNNGHKDNTFCYDFGSDFETVFDFIRQIEWEWIVREEFWQCALQTQFNSFILYIIRKSNLYALPVETSKQPSLLADVHLYLTANYTDDISLDKLADRFSMNKYYLAHTFKETYGDSIISTLNKIRCNTAQHLLQNTDHSISEISTSVGYNSSSYFSKTYKKIIGESPLQTRSKRQ